MMGDHDVDAPPIILHVDDNESDLELVQLALTDLVGDQVRYVGLSDGESALTFLRDLVQPPAQRVALILLDINAPRVSGWDVVARLRSDVLLKDIPVMMLSGSRANRDQAQAQELGVGYLVKPGTFTDLGRTLAPVLAVHGLHTGPG